MIWCRMGEHMSNQNEIIRMEAETLATIGDAYYRGLGVEQNYGEALKFYQKAAGMGNARSMSRIGLCHELGFGTKKDIEAAFSCYEDASEQGDVFGLIKLGDFYRDGVPHLVQKDMQTASEYYLDALEQVQYGRDLWYAPDVYLRVADFLKDGIVTEKNLHSAYDFYVSAAEGFMNRIENGDLDCADSLDLAEEGAEACRRILGQ